MYKAIAAVVGSLMLASAADAATIDVDNFLEASPLQSGSGLAATSTISPVHGQMGGQAYQTWTVGRTGKLDRIDIFGGAARDLSSDNVVLTRDNDFLVTLTILAGGTEWSPGSVELGSVSRSANELGQGLYTTSSFDLSGLGLSANQGDLLTFRMSVEGCPQITYCHTLWVSPHTIYGVGTTNGYEGGRAFTLTQSGLWAWDYDLNFRTWTSAVPEPSTWAMMIVGFGAVGSMVRTSRRRNALSAA